MKIAKFAYLSVFTAAVSLPAHAATINVPRVHIPGAATNVTFWIHDKEEKRHHAHWAHKYKKTAHVGRPHTHKVARAHYAKRVKLAKASNP